jgi:hypothetical protein
MRDPVPTDASKARLAGPACGRRADPIPPGIVKRPQLGPEVPACKRARAIRSKRGSRSSYEPLLSEDPRNSGSSALRDSIFADRHLALQATRPSGRIRTSPPVSGSRTATMSVLPEHGSLHGNGTEIAPPDQYSSALRAKCANAHIIRPSSSL